MHLCTVGLHYIRTLPLSTDPMAVYVDYTECTTASKVTHWATLYQH